MKNGTLMEQQIFILNNINKDIYNYNTKGQLHGYQERHMTYFLDGKVVFKITYRGIMKNNLDIGYEEYHTSKHTNFNIK